MKNKKSTLICKKTMDLNLETLGRNWTFCNVELYLTLLCNPIGEGFCPGVPFNQPLLEKSLHES